VRERVAIVALPLDEEREAVAGFLVAVLDAVARPFEDTLEVVLGAALPAVPLTPEDARPLDAEAERPLEAEADRPLVDDDLVAAVFLVLRAFVLRLPTDALLLEERPEDDARPEDWLRDFFINVWFYNDD